MQTEAVNSSYLIAAALLVFEPDAENVSRIIVVNNHLFTKNCRLLLKFYLQYTDDTCTRQ